MKIWKWIFITTVFLAICFLTVCGDDDDNEKETSDDIDENEGPGPNDHNDDYTPIGNCDTVDVYEAIKWLMEDCYILEDDEGNSMTADSVCESADADVIYCYIKCLDCEADLYECGGDPDPLYECLLDCVLSDDIDNNYDPLECDGDVCVDPNSGLMWQNDSDCFYDLYEARSYCENLNIGGFSDWRLPSIDELRSLIRGCDDTETGGSCGVTDDCLIFDCYDCQCNGCLLGDGPGQGEAYWPAELIGDVWWYWSNSMVTDSDGYFMWFIGFGSGSVIISSINIGEFYARCVR